MPTHGSARNVLDHNALNQIVRLQPGEMRRPHPEWQKKFRECFCCGGLPRAEVVFQAVLNSAPFGCVSLKIDWLKCKVANLFQQFAFLLCAEKIRLVRQTFRQFGRYGKE